MIRVVADTNIIVSGLLWHGAPRRLLDSARTGSIELFTSAALLVELEDVLQRQSFAQRLVLVDLAPRELVLDYAALTTVIEPADIAPAVLADPDDDAVLACAIGAQADAIVSGDSHLLKLKEYGNIPILSAVDLLARIPL